VKLLLDSCIWGLAKVQLQESGHDAVWAGDWDADPGDEEILRRATSENRILVTLDKDFGELVVVRGHLHSGIIRLVNFTAKQQALACALVLDRHGQELEAGAIITAEPGRLRIRSAEKDA
jgi:predicted nuclease of predicted toxin-antitoxin system